MDRRPAMLAWSSINSEDRVQNERSKQKQTTSRETEQYGVQYTENSCICIKHWQRL